MRPRRCTKVTTQCGDFGVDGILGAVHFVFRGEFAGA
jgi:hypothetical protein